LAKPQHEIMSYATSLLATSLGWYCDCILIVDKFCCFSQPVVQLGTNSSTAQGWCYGCLDVCIGFYIHVCMCKFIIVWLHHIDTLYACIFI
jgi:hypothetical protein